MQSDAGLIKLGRAIEPEKRRRVLVAGTGVDLQLHHATELREDASYVEAIAHNLLATKRRHGEWFDVTADEAVAALYKAIAEVQTRKDIQRCRKCKPAPVSLRLENRINRTDHWNAVARDPKDSPKDKLLRYICSMERVRKDRTITVRITNEARDMLKSLCTIDNRSAASWLEHTIRRAHQELTGPTVKAKK